MLDNHVWIAFRALSLAALVGCGKAPSSPNVVRLADASDRDHVRWLPRTFAGYGPAHQDRPTGDAVPFVDRNANGRYDMFVDPLGYCDSADDCRIPDRRLTIHRLRRNGVVGSSAGVFVWAQIGGRPAGDAIALDIPVCDDDSVCSQPLKLPFDVIPPQVQALWVCSDEPESLDVKTLSVEGARPAAFTHHPHLRLVVEARPALEFEIRASETIDRILARVVRLENGNVESVAWSSAAHPDSLREESWGASLILPATAACEDCVLMIQAVHVWRDDDLRDLSEAWLTLPFAPKDS